ncbi:hypothetical protein SAMN04487898_12521 [Pedobacter sp. ok626]|nr:hypothetical protein SAMN04487898_12521 [Pedobacter sp. ok626]
MRILYGLCFFYQKLIIPSLVISIVLSFLMMKVIDLYVGIGISFIFLTPVFHYLIYEIRTPNEYYFYYNLGLSKIVLWTNTIIVSLIVGLLFILL